MKLEAEIRALLPLAHSRPIEADGLTELQSEKADLPTEYVEFLLTFGSGVFGGVNIYSGPCRPSTCYWKETTEDDYLIVAGDDGCGRYYCFDSRYGNQLVVKGAEHETEKALGVSFDELIHRFLVEASEWEHGRKAREIERRKTRPSLVRRAWTSITSWTTALFDRDEDEEPPQKLSEEEYWRHQSQYTRAMKIQLIETWQTFNGKEWPRYAETVTDSRGKPLRQAGRCYDIHYIIRQGYGGPHLWFNVIPAHRMLELPKILASKEFRSLQP